MKVTFFKEDNGMGWWWYLGEMTPGRVPANPTGYALTKLGAIWAAKRYIRNTKYGVQMFEKELK